MKNRMLELSNELSDLIIDSEFFNGNLELRKFKDGSFSLSFLHLNNYYRYGNSSIEVYSFSNDGRFEDFKNQAIDCIENGTFLKDWGAL